MIIPELVNSKLNKKSLLELFLKLLNEKDFRKEQISNINSYLHLIESDNSPYEISVKRISNLL